MCDEQVNTFGFETILLYTYILNALKRNTKDDNSKFKIDYIKYNQKKTQCTLIHVF